MSSRNMPLGYHAVRRDALLQAQTQEYLSHQGKAGGTHHLPAMRCDIKRIMAITDQARAILVTATDVHLARGIGEAVHHAYQGELEFQYQPDGHLLRVHWER